MRAAPHSRRALRCAVAGLMVGAAPLCSAQESPKDIIAAHIRNQGYACDAPQSAKRDLSASKPNSAVWLLKCRNASYRVRLVPDMAAGVEKID